jgi:DNA repair and recombination RAD54-like protein
LLNLPDDLPGCQDVLTDDYQMKGAGGSARYVDCSYSGKFMVLERYVEDGLSQTDCGG